MNELLIAVVSVGLIVAFAATLVAFVLDRRSREVPTKEVVRRTVLLLIVGFFLPAAIMFVWLMSLPCPEDSVCDAPAMAAVGAVLLGSAAVVAALVIGGPVAYVVLRRLRHK